MVDQQKIEEQSELALCLGVIAQKQDAQAFQRMFEHYAGRVKSYALKSPGMSGSADLAEEVVQETMLKIWRKAALFDQSKTNVDAWVFTIARNVRIDIQRRNIRNSGELHADDLWHDIDSPGPLVNIRQNQVSESIHAGLKDINAEQALVLKKMYLEGKTQSAIADEFNLPLGTVKSRTRLALARLKLLLKEKDL